MIERIEKIEEEINLIKYNFEFNKKLVQSEIDKTKALQGFVLMVNEYIKENDEKVSNLNELLNSLISNAQINSQLIESMQRTQKTIIEIISNK